MRTLVSTCDDDDYFEDENVDKENMDIAQERPTKRAAVASSADEKRERLKQFAPGSVTRVKLHNFMTYNDAEFVPGPRLNLVLGPNGTGKSSLVCALCLGLAGGSKLLGRGDNVKEYIQRGKDMAWVEVSLSKGDGTEHVIRREMKKVKNDDKITVVNSWKIDNHSNMRQKDVEKLMGKLNIQLDNLCQFLPQDKVVEFARLSPSELLAETQKALGDSHLYNLHQELITKGQELEAEKTGTAGKAAQLEKLQRDHERQGPEYERFRKKAALEAEIKLLQKKIAMLELEAKKSVYAASVAEYKVALQEWRDHEREAKKHEGPYKALQEKAKKRKGEAQKLREFVRALQGDTDKAEKDAVDLDNEISKINQDIKLLAQQSEERKKRIAQAKQDIADKEAELATLPRGATQMEAAQLSQIQQHQHQLHQKAGAADSAADSISHDIQDCEGQIVRLQEKLQRLQNSSSIRLRQLENRFRGIIQVYQYVKQNQRAFTGQVFGPIALEVQVHDPQHAKYVEKQVPSWVWGAFVVLNRNDAEILEGIQREFGCRTSIITYTSSDFNAPLAHRMGEPAAFAQFDIQHTLDQVMDAPNVVKRAMDEHTGLSMAYVGTLNTNQYFQQLQAANLPVVYTPDTKVSFTTSRYNSSSVSSNYDTIPAQLRFLVGGVDPREVGATRAELERLQQETQLLQQEYDRLSAEATLHKEQMHKLKGTLNALNAAVKQRDSRYASVLSYVNGRKTALQKLLSEQEPLDNEDDYKEEMRLKADKLHQKVKQVVNNVAKHWDRIQKLAVMELEAKELEMMEAAMRDKNKEQEDKGRQLKQRELMLQTKSRQDKEAVVEATRKAERRGALEESIQDQLAAIQLDQEAIHDKIEAKQAEVAGMVVNDSSVAQRYEARAKQIAELQEELKSLEERLTAMEADIEDVKGRWLPELEAMTAKINATFSRNFEEMGCAGEVALKRHSDFDKWAMEIRVKFREGEELQVLTAQRQSGGERSVSTILYLIALQDVTVTPFRVVDEINQGMDPQNERKVYTQLVEASTKDSTPQCFLLTPKLLPDLIYNEHITILEIFNGREIERPVKEQRDMDALMFGTRHL